MSDTERVVRRCAAKLPGDSRTILQHVLDGQDEPNVCLTKLAAEFDLPEREVRIRWLAALVNLRTRFGAEPEIQEWYNRVTTTDVDYTRFGLRAIVNIGVSKLPERQRDVIEICLDQIRQSKRPNILQASIQLGIGFPACRERLVNGVRNLTKWLSSEPTVLQLIGESENDSLSPTEIVSRFVRSLEE